jgi:hypothetical protein
MTHDEKRAWIRLVVSVIGYATYVVVVLTRADGRPLPDVPYAAALLWTVGAAIGAVAAMLMALAEWDWFWIANVIYLCFVLSAILGGIIKVVVYRRSFPQW